MTNFVGPARRITAADVESEAKYFNIELAALRAVMAVESRNTGYDSKRRPIILFEPHVFYRNLHGNQRAVAVANGLAYEHWKNSYPSGSDAQYARLTRAIEINPEAAYRSISIGMGQILGENYKLAEYPSAEKMFEDAMVSETNQLKQMIGFIINKGLKDELNRHDWHSFAAGYNGSGQVDKYAAWLQREYNKWRRITSKPREELDAQDLRDAGSKTVEDADFGQKAVKTAAVVGPTAGAVLDAATQGMEPVNKAIDTAKQAKGAWEWLHENWQFMLVFGLTALFLVLCYFAYKAFHNVIEQRVQNARDGLNVRI
jgi:hypothetical protein